MATEASPSTSIISLSSYTTAAAARIISATSAANSYSYQNLRTPIRSSTWRSTTTLTDQTIAFDLGSAVQPTVFALINNNLVSTGSGTTLQVVLQSSTAADFGTSLRTYTYTIYEQSSSMKVLRFYVGNPDSSSAVSSQYWRVTFNAGSAGTNVTYFECGLIWLGTYTTMSFDPGLNITSEDLSQSGSSLNGSVYFDRIRTVKSADLNSTNIANASALSIKEALDVVGSSRYVFVDTYAHLSNVSQKSHGAYYGLLDKISMSHKFGRYAIFDFAVDGDV